MKPDAGDLITESVWSVKNKQSLLFCPIFKNQPLDKTFNINSYNFQNIHKTCPQNYVP